jgi:hypothetical protein
LRCSALTPARFRRPEVRPPHLLAILCLAFFGCATSGPNHVYLTTAGNSEVRDLGPPAAIIADILKPGEHAAGLAYDFNTDHLFVSVTPANAIRVIERPSGKMLREMKLPPEFAGSQSGDLAIRSSDRHLFVAHPDGKSVVELTLFGVFVRRIELNGLDGRIGGLAYDRENQRLLVLTSTSPARVGTVGPDGTLAYYARLAGATRPVSLGYDSDARHFYVPLGDGNGVGEFDANGHLVATSATGDTVTALDAGPRSFVRVF